MPAQQSENIQRFREAEGYSKAKITMSREMSEEGILSLS